VAGVVAPDVEAARYVFVAEDLREVFVVAAAHVFVAGGEDVGVVLVLVEEPGVGEVGQIVGGDVVVAVVVVVAVEEAGWIEGSAEGEDGVEDVGVAEGDVGGVIAAEAAADGGEVGEIVGFADEGEDLLHDVLLVLDVAGNAPAGADVAVVPALGVDGIEAEELECSAVELVLDGVDHATVFELEEAAAGGRKDDRGDAGVAEGE